MVSSGRRARRLFLIAGSIVAGSGWVLFAYPAIRGVERFGWLSALSTLLRPVNAFYPDGYFIGWFVIGTGLIIIAALALGLLQALAIGVRYIEASEAAISVIESEFVVYIEDESMTSSSTQRSQKFHANRHDISAYTFTSSATAPNGTIDGASYDVWSVLNDRKITATKMVTGSDKRVEVIEILSRSLPTSWLATYLTDNMVLFLFNHTRLFDNVVVERYGEVVNKNEFNVPEPMFEVNSPRYRASNVTIKINFPARTAPGLDDISCYIIRQTVVTQLHPKYTLEGGRRMLSITVPSLYQETLRIRWKNVDPATPRPTRW